MGVGERGEYSVSETSSRNPDDHEEPYDRIARLLITLDIVRRIIDDAYLNNDKETVRELFKLLRHIANLVDRWSGLNDHSPSSDPDW